MKSFSAKLVLSLVFCTAVFAVNINPSDWGSWGVVDNTSGNLDQVAMAVGQGKVAIVYQKAAVSGGDAKLLYSEYIYSSKYGKTLTIVDEVVPNSVATWGTNICGIDFDFHGQAFIAIVPNQDGTTARVLRRVSNGVYEIFDAQDANTMAATSFGVTRESFVFDSNNYMHFVWASDASGTRRIVHATRDGDFEHTGATWSRSTMETSGVLNRIRPGMAVDASFNPHISYIGDNSGSSIFYTSDMLSGEVTGYCGVGEPGPYHDIELSLTGQVMIAHMNLGTGSIVIDKDFVSLWRKLTVISNIDPRNYWDGVVPCFDLELDGNGDIAIAVAHLDNVDLGANAKTIVEYCTYVSSVAQWSRYTIGTFDSGADFAASVALKFDENGKPFVTVITKQSPSGNSEVFLLTTNFSGPEYCGDYYTSYLPGDLNKDCYVNVQDLRSMADDWLKCTAPGNSDCTDVGELSRNVEGFPPVMEVDGKPFFPIGWYCATEDVPNPGTQEGLNQNATAFLTEIAATGANFVMPFGISRGTSNYMTAFLEAGLTTGVKTMINIDPPAGSQVEFCKNYNSLFGWYTSDEPEAYNILPTTLQGIYEDIRASDTGNHPVLVTHHTGWYAVTPYLWPSRDEDLLATDYYPNWGSEFQGPFWLAAQAAQYYSKITQLHNLSAHIGVPAAFMAPGWRLPTYAEERYMVFGPVVYGVRGFLFFKWEYGWDATFCSTVMTPVIGELNLLSQAIMSNSTAVTVSSNRDMDTTGHYVKDIGYLFGQDNNYGYLIAVNNTPSTYSAQLYLEGHGLLEAVGSGDVSVPVISESRNILMQASTPEHWTISDTFMPYAVHVYRLYSVPTPQQCGDIGSVHPVNDLNNDCYVNFLDFAVLANDWLKCNDPADNVCP